MAELVESMGLFDYLVSFDVRVANLIIQFANDRLLEVIQDLRSLILGYISVQPSLQNLIGKNVEHFLKAENA